MEKNKDEGKNFTKILATWIVDLRYVIFILFAVAVVYCAISISKVQVNGDITYFLPDEAETKQALTIMDDEFITYGSASVMVSNITYEEAERLADEIELIDGVFSVELDNTTAHYVNSSALLSVTFDGTDDDELSIEAQEEIELLLSDYDVYLDSSVGESATSTLESEIGGVMLIAIVVIVAVLLLTSRSYFEVVIFLIVFAVAAVLNMGTNFWLGEISSITNTIAVILQLALAIDYSIILIHRYHDELENYPTEREALIEALSKAIVEILSSCLTTISGLIALTFMQFRLGYDLGVVLTKGIICSILTVFFLMPGVIMLFPGMLRKSTHRSFIPNVRPWGKFLVNSKYCFAIVFIIILPVAIFCSSKVDYVFSEESVDELTSSESREVMHKINDTFDKSTSVVVIIPHEELGKERELLSELSELPGTKSATGLANVTVDDEYVLTESLTPHMFAELVDIDYDLSKLLYQAYGIENEEYEAIFGDTDEYSVPLVDMLLYLFDMMDSGVVTLEGDMADDIDELRDTLERAVAQLRGTNYNRLVLTTMLDVEGEESEAYIEEIRAIAESYYGEGNILVAGDITSALDLADSYNSDSMKINILTIVFVFLILLLTFKSVVGAALLVFVIQGSIWINFAVFYIEGMRTSFVTYMIVSAIQMGATIDYAIVAMNRYQSLKVEGYERREAMTHAVNESFATCLTSGSILTIAGFLIAYKMSDVYVSHIGLAVGRGALVSIILVLTVLPQLIVMLDKLIDKTRFGIKVKLVPEELEIRGEDK